ncbi:cation diffusion facilitator family transporter [Dehalococcoidia bacterium]|nr:cation diffusion facilitator family transporter [Dehalococcoidia bacterium]
MFKVNLFDSKTCTLIGIGTNLSLMVLKLLAGIFGLSYAMIADAIHSASDSLAGITAYLGIRLGEKPADQNHPYGHANAETIAAFFVALIILGTGVFIGVSAVGLMASGHFETPTTLALVAALISIVVKEGIFRYTLKVGQRNNSPAVIASAWDHRADVYSSATALAGIIGAKLWFVYLDPIAGIVIAALIVRVSIKLLRTNVGILMDESPDGSFLSLISDTTGAIEGVRAVDGVKAHRCGPVYIVDIKIAVDGRLTMEQSHQIASAVRGQLLQKVRHVHDVMVHVNPHRPDQALEGGGCDRER